MTNTERLKNFLCEHYQEASPRVSIYMPTHRKAPDNKQDPINFKNFILEAKEILDAKYSRREWEPIIERLETLQRAVDFWNRTTEGLVVLADGQGLNTFLLEQTIPAKMVVEEHFYIVPLMKYYDPIGMGYLVDLGKDRFGFYRVTRNAISEVEQDEIKTSFPELFDDLDVNANLNFGSYGGGYSSFHGHRAKPEQQEKDREKYFRYIDKMLAEYFSNNDTPVILSGIPSNIAEFKKYAKAGFYTDQSIEKPLDSMDYEQKKKSVQEILQPRYEEKTAKLKEQFGLQVSQGMVRFGLDQVEEPAKNGRIETLIISEKHGFEDQSKLNDVISHVISSGGEIYVLDADQSDYEISAILRY